MWTSHTQAGFNVSSSELLLAIVGPNRREWVSLSDNIKILTRQKKKVDRHKTLAFVACRYISMAVAKSPIWHVKTFAPL